MGVDLEIYFWPSPEQDLNSRPLRTDPGGQSPHRHHCVANEVQRLNQFRQAISRSLALNVAVFAVLYMAEMLPLL